MFWLDLTVLQDSDVRFLEDIAYFQDHVFEPFDNIILIFIVYFIKHTVHFAESDACGTVCTMVRRVWRCIFVLLLKQLNSHLRKMVLNLCN